MAETFEITLGPKYRYSDEQHNSKDYHREVLIDFSISEGASLGWLAAIHETHGAEIDHWALIGEDGEALPGLRLTYKTKAAALAAAYTWICAYTYAIPA